MDVDRQSFTSTAEASSLGISSGGLSSDKPSAKLVDISAADPPDLVYAGAVRVCETCQEPSDSRNPLYKCQYLPKSKMILRMYRPWYRYDSSGFPEGRRCMICVLFADKAYKVKGGRKALNNLNGQEKAQHKVDCKEFVELVLEGKMLQAEKALGTSVSISREQSLKVQTAWDFVTEKYLLEQGEEVDDSSLRYFIHNGEQLRGVWRLASQLFPPPGILRVISEDNTTASKKEELDHSRNAVRRGQLDDTFEAARHSVDIGAIQNRTSEAEPTPMSSASLDGGGGSAMGSLGGASGCLRDDDSGADMCFSPQDARSKRSTASAKKSSAKKVRSQAAPSPSGLASSSVASPSSAVTKRKGGSSRVRRPCHLQSDGDW